MSTETLERPAEEAALDESPPPRDRPPNQLSFDLGIDEGGAGLRLEGSVSISGAIPTSVDLHHDDEVRVEIKSAITGKVLATATAICEWPTFKDHSTKEDEWIERKHTLKIERDED